MDESSAELLSAHSQRQNNNNTNSNSSGDDDDQASAYVDSKNANASLVNVQNVDQTDLLDIDSSDLDYDSLDDDQIEIETMLLQAMDSHASENSTINPDAVGDTNPINTTIDDDNDFKHSAENNNIPTTSNENYHVSHHADQTKPIESHTNDMMIEPKPLPIDTNNHLQNTENNNVSTIDVNTERYDSAEEGEPIFDFLGKANEIVCCSNRLLVFFYLPLLITFSHLCAVHDTAAFQLISNRI